MSDRSSKANVLAALRVRRNAVRGFTYGGAFAVSLFVTFVLLPGSVRSPVWYVGLGFVVAFASGFLATLLLVARTARRRARAEREDDAPTPYK